MGKPKHTLLGDRSTITQTRKRSRVHEFANTRVVLTGAARSTCIPTRDKADRAHAVVDHLGMLRPGGSVPNATPRMYPQSQMTSGGVAFDSSYDETYGRGFEFARAGINLGFGASRNTDDESRPTQYDAFASRCYAAPNAKQLRARLEKWTECEMTPAEAELEKLATEMLEASD